MILAWASPFKQIELVGRGSDIQLQVGGIQLFNLAVQPLKRKFFLWKLWKPKLFFSVWKQHKCLRLLFTIHLNTYGMGLRPLEIFLLLYSAGIDFSRQNLTSTDVRFWRLKSIPAL